MSCRSLTKWFANASRESIDQVFLITFGLAGIIVSVAMIVAFVATATQS